MKEIKATGIKRIFNAFFYSMDGLKAAWKNEAAFRQEFTMFLLLLPAAFIIGNTAVERAVLIASWMIVLITELLNSAIESVVDRIGKEYHELSGRAKDMGSAAVFISLCLAAVVWGLILAQRILNWF